MKPKIEWNNLPILQSHSLTGGGTLVVYNADSVFTVSKSESERNVFCYNSDGSLRWRVGHHDAVERGSSFQGFSPENDSTGHLFDDSGSQFAVNLANGELTFLDWDK